MNTSPTMVSCDLIRLIVLDDYDRWYKLLQESEHARDFVRSHQEQLKELSSSKLCEVRLGLEHSLTTSQIEDYAKSAFSQSQMKCIREAYKKGLSKEQVCVFLSAEFSKSQMQEIIFGFLYGLSIEQVKSYANPTYDFATMYDMRNKLEQEHKINKLYDLMNNF